MQKLSFTAEASLYKAGGFYAAMETYTEGYRQRVFVQPAAIVNCLRLCGLDPDCLHCCRCLARGGEPAHCCS
jgi:hypothetical protein